METFFQNKTGIIKFHQFDQHPQQICWLSVDRL